MSTVLKAKKEQRKKSQPKPRNVFTELKKKFQSIDEGSEEMQKAEACKVINNTQWRVKLYIESETEARKHARESILI